MTFKVRTNSIKHFGKRIDFGAMRSWRNGSGDVKTVGWAPSGFKLKKNTNVKNTLNAQKAQVLNILVKKQLHRFAFASVQMICGN